MFEHKGIIDEAIEFFTKILIPAVIGITLKVAVALKLKKEKMTVFNVVLSFLIGIGCAYFAYPVIPKDSKFVPLIIGIVAMAGERISEYFIYRMDVEKFIEFFIGQIKNNNKK